MAEQDTPTIDEVRAAWQEHFTHPGVGELGEQFDRFIAQVRAEALRDAADRLCETDPVETALSGVNYPIQWLRAEADRIADTNQRTDGDNT